MLISMTGFGRAEGQVGETSVAIELRAVNSRYLEFVVRFPMGYEELEDLARNHLQSILNRGRITMTMNIGGEQTTLGYPSLNEELLLHYQQLANRSSELLGRDVSEISQADLLRMPDVIAYTSDEENRDAYFRAIMNIVKEATEKLQTMRKREGELLEKTIFTQLEGLSEILGRIKAADEGRLEGQVDRLRQKLRELTAEADTQAMEKRLEQEMVLWSDKLDIAEELTRMEAHIQHFKDLINENGDAGKRLNFLLQEMNREANTIGSKANETTISHAVVELKNEVERLREQVQNIQ